MTYSKSTDFASKDYLLVGNPSKIIRGTEIDDELVAIESEFTNGVVAKTGNAGSAKIPVGTQAQRDVSPVAGYTRFNSTSGAFEGYNGTEWGPLGSNNGPVVDVEVYVATAGQTVFPLVNGYTVGKNQLEVYVDGVNQYDGTTYSYVETDYQTVTFTTGLTVGASVKFCIWRSDTMVDGDAANMSYSPAGGASVATTVQAKLRESVSVKDFGAVGDGVADDTVAIQAALTNGIQVYLPRGTYKITSTITVPSNGCLVGDGPGSVIVNASDFRGVQTNGTNVLIANLRIVGSGSPVSPVDGRGGILVENATNVQIANVQLANVRTGGIACGDSTQITLTNFIVENTYEHGVYFSQCTKVTVTNGLILDAGKLTGYSGSGLKFAGCSDVNASNIIVRNANVYGVIVEGYASPNTSNRVNLSNISAQGNASGGSGLRVVNYVDDLNVSGGEYSGDYGITFIGTNGTARPTNVRINNVATYGGGAYGIRVYQGNAVSIFGGSHSGGSGYGVYVGDDAEIVYIYNAGATSIRTIASTLIYDNKLSDGSASEPSLAFLTNLNTGFYKYGTNEIGVALNGINAGTFAGARWYIRNNAGGSPSLRWDYTNNWSARANGSVTNGFQFDYNDSRVAHIESTGSIYNLTGTYGTISDIKLKQDIEDASSQWDDIKAIRFRKYRLKSDPTGPLLMGVVAQELEQTSPGLIDETEDFEEVESIGEDGEPTVERHATGETTKSVKYSIVYLKAVKALQEAMARIEALESVIYVQKPTNL